MLRYKGEKAQTMLDMVRIFSIIILKGNSPQTGEWFSTNNLNTCSNLFYNMRNTLWKCPWFRIKITIFYKISNCVFVLMLGIILIHDVGLYTAVTVV